MAARRFENEPGSENFTQTLGMYNELGKLLRERHGLTVEQFRILLRLCKCDGPLACIELARMMDVPRSSVTMSIKGMAAKGLVRAEIDPKSGRTRKLQVTEHGKIICKQGRAECSEAFAEDISALPQKSQEMLMNMLAVLGDRQGMLQIEGGGLDMIYLVVELCSKSKQFFSRTIRDLGLWEPRHLLRFFTESELSSEKAHHVFQCARIAPSRPLFSR
ncbi:MAG: MarR family winged helix-turn-helix transcriptional regulator [Coriobacteriales bacterium]|jgi:MarR family transcriptional regulator for hemolysin